jgi:ligand-binding sensor domain-containing protein
MIGSDSGLFLSESVNGGTRGSTILRGRSINDMAALGGQAALALDNGLILLVPSTQTQVRFTTMEGLPSNQLRNLAVAADTTLWIATAGGLAHFEPGSNRITSWNVARGLPSNSCNGVAVQRVAQLGRDIVWVATSAGVARLDPSTNVVTTYTVADGLPSNNVLAVHVLANGTKLFGTASGLAHYVGF